MKEYMQIGSAPYNVDCAQVGSTAYNYDARSRIECYAFLDQIKRVCGEPPEGAGIIVKSFPHDFGAYREVCVVYDDQNEEATQYAFKCESADIGEWDDEAIKELIIKSDTYRDMLIAEHRNEMCGQIKLTEEEIIAYESQLRKMDNLVLNKFTYLNKYN